MTSNTTAGVGQLTTGVVVTVSAGAAGGPFASEDRFDPFLPAVEPAVEELSLQESMDVNKESLERKLMSRRSVAVLADQGIYPPLKTPPTFAEQRKHLEMAKTSDLLRKKLTARPDRQCLVQHHILEDTSPLVDSCVQERHRQLKRCRLQENLSDHLVHRPGPLDLVQANILKLDPEELFGADAGLGSDDSDLWSSLDELLQDDSYEGSQNSPTSLVAGTTDFPPLYDQDDVFSPMSSASSSGLSPVAVPSATIAQCQQEIPIPPDISPLLRGYCGASTSEQTVSRVPTPPDITPLLRGALSSANIQLPPASAQLSSTMSTPATSKSSASRSNVSKKSRPKIGTKSKVIKFHQYFGPKNLQQQLEPCASSSTSTADTPFNILLQQQQMLLRWQLEFQQKNMQFLLSKPSNDLPQPALPKMSSATLAPQPTMTNVSVKPSASVAVNPALAAKRSRLEEMKVAELREECRRLNIYRSGAKPVLIERLLQHADSFPVGGSASGNKSAEQFEASPSSVSSVPPLSMSGSDVKTDAGIIFNMQQPARMMTTDNSTTGAVSCDMSAVLMDVDSVPCKEEPTSPEIAQSNVYPMMLIPPSNSGQVVQASVSSTVPPLIVFRPTAQPVMRPADVPKPFPSMLPLLQEQILLEQQRHISELEHHLQLSQHELMRAQQQAQLQRMFNGDASAAAAWMKNTALNGMSVSASMSLADSRTHDSTTPQLLRTNSLLDTSSASAFDSKLRRTMTSPYISTTADMAVDSNRRSLPPFAYTVPVHESLPSVRNRTIDDVLDVLISSGDLPASAADSFTPQGSQLTTSVASSCPMYFFPNTASVSSTNAMMPGGSVASATASKQFSASDASSSMEWYSGDSSQPARTTTDGSRIDVLYPTDLVDFGGLLSKSSISSDLGNIDMTDFDDILQSGCGISSDFINLADDCDFCSPADGVRATFEKLMEVTTSNS